MWNQTVGEMGRGSFAQWWGLIRLWLNLWGYVAASSAKGGDGETESDLRYWNRRDALAVGGRRTIKEGRMPISDDRPSFAHHGCCGSDPDQNNPSDHDHERHYRVHRGAKPTNMISGVPNRMAVVTWDTARSTSKMRHTTAACPKVFGIGRRSLRECARISVKEASSPK